MRETKNCHSSVKKKLCECGIVEVGQVSCPQNNDRSGWNGTHQSHWFMNATRQLPAVTQSVRGEQLQIYLSAEVLVNTVFEKTAVAFDIGARRQLIIKAVRVCVYSLQYSDRWLAFFYELMNYVSRV